MGQVDRTSEKRQRKPIKDITDLRNHYRGENFQDLLAHLQDKARLIDKGVDIEAYTMAELEQQYITEIESFSEVSVLSCKLQARAKTSVRSFLVMFWVSLPGLDNSKAQRRRTSWHAIQPCPRSSANSRFRALSCSSGARQSRPASTPQRFITVTGREIGSIGAPAERCATFGSRPAA